mgnify:FL=1
MSILTDIFAKRGIKDVTDLDKEEREVFENYEKILSKDELTLEDIKHFLEDQIRVIENKWRDYGTKNKASLIPYHTIYCVLRDVINSPQVEREQLEKHLKQIHNL